MSKLHEPTGSLAIRLRCQRSRLLCLWKPLQLPRRWKPRHRHRRWRPNLWWRQHQLQKPNLRQSDLYQPKWGRCSSKWWQLKYVWEFSSRFLGKMIQFDERIFQMGWFNHQLVIRIIFGILMIDIQYDQYVHIHVCIYICIVMYVLVYVGYACCGCDWRGVKEQIVSRLPMRCCGIPMRCCGIT